MNYRKHCFAALPYRKRSNPISRLCGGYAAPEFNDLWGYGRQKSPNKILGAQPRRIKNIYSGGA
jgi:hypothetical protein